MRQDSATIERDVNQRGITNIIVHGFKSISEETTIEIRPLTILAGANSSGKSSIMQPLLLMKQTLEAVYDPGSLLLDGPNVRFTSAEQFLSLLAELPPDISFEIGVEIDGDMFLSNTFEKQRQHGIELSTMSFGSKDTKAMLTFPMAHDEIVPVVNEIAKGMRWEGKNMHWKLRRERCFFNLDLTLGEETLQTLDIASPFKYCIRHIIHVPGLRGNPQRTYKTTAVSAEFPGTFENYVASVVKNWRTKQDYRIDILGQALATLCLTWRVTAHQIDDTQVELQVGRLPYGTKKGKQDMVSVADVGFGVSQVLPVLVGLLVAEPGQLVYLEQPELHLHPRAQVALAQILADAANRGVRVVAETHSSLLLLGVQSLVAEGYISPDKVKLHWFKRRDDGVTEVSSTDLDRAGSFGDWPEDFAEVDLAIQSRYLNAAESRQQTK